ncbi:MAG: adenosylcobinamide-phosphate synthase CbiB [Pleurocapsa sp.]
MLHSTLVLLLAAITDFLIGDPRNWLHPVQVMGWMTQNYTKIAIALFDSPWQRRLSGIVLGLGLILGTGFVSWIIIRGANQVNSVLGIVTEVVLLASCLAGKSLRLAVDDVLQPLKAEDIKTARNRLSYYVGRDTDNLSEREIFRALLETVGENAVDGITAPLFYGILGGLLPEIGCVPLALAYKAASTLDSMVGYRREPYVDIGWFSAQLEDRLTWLPCRLTVLTLSLFSGKPRQVLAICRRDAVQDPSPNSGWSECVYGAILGVQLGGINTYQGEVKEKPLLGNPLEPISQEKIAQALTLTRYCLLCWLAIATILLLGLAYFSLNQPITSS